MTGVRMKALGKAVAVVEVTGEKGGQMRTMTWFNWVMVAGLAVVAACGSSERRGPGSSVDGDPMTEGGPQKLDPNDINFEDPDGNPQTPSSGICEKMDILFVIDNSGSMEPAQQSLKKNFPRFMQVLSDFESSQGTELDYRVGVTTTSVTYSLSVDAGLGVPLPLDAFQGLDGKLRDGCGLEHPYVTRDVANVQESFSCLASVGTMGSGLEMPIQATLLATSEAANQDFFREDALLAVVILTDENDCSRKEREIMLDSSQADTLGDPLQFLCGNEADLVSPSDIMGQLDAFKSDRSRWAVSVIGWHPDDNTCEGKLHPDSQPAERLASFVDQAGENAVFSSICQDDLSGALTDAMNNFNFACESFIR